MGSKIQKKILLFYVIVISIFIINTITFATTNQNAPKLTDVRRIVEDGLDLFFGALSSIAVVIGGFEFFRGFMAYRDSRAKGGYGESKSDFVHHIISGALCLIGAVLVYTVLGWAKELFNL